MNKGLDKNEPLEHRKDIHGELFISLKNALETEKCFLDVNLTLVSLAIKLNTNREYLSKTINHYFGKNYFDCINQYRITHAVNLLEEISNKKLKSRTMLKVANASGFKSTSTFNPAFKKIMGSTPSEYKQQIKAGNTKGQI